MRKKAKRSQTLEPTTAVEVSAEDKKKRQMADIKFFLTRLVAMGIFLYLIFGFFFGIMPMKDDTMKPRVSAGDLLIMYRMDPRVRINDVIIYKKDGKKYVGRVVAQGGDEVDISNDQHLKINGNVVIEQDIYYKTGQYEDGIKFPVKLSEKTYFVLSDMREGGKDSRVLGPVNKKEIVGKVITVIRRSGI